MFDLRDILKLVIDGFNEGTFAKENFIHQTHQLLFHLLLASRN